MQKKWWHDKVAYQIYPKSFYDTTGNGIGDLRGIIRKLDYLKTLGIDIIWLSPCYCSPLADQGYDISDYYNIDPRFGTMQDMEELIAEARKRDMYILMDLVVNHCSDEHAWFQNALQNPDGEYGNYFYMEKGIDGHAPNNWRSYFGGSVWEPIPGTDYYYLHMFHKKQPDLNWENPKVREEIYRMINWWLDKGLAGFRIDAIMNIKKALPFAAHNYPADRDDGLVSPRKMLADTTGIGDFLTELRDRTFARYDAFTAGEVFNEKEEELPAFIGENGYFSTKFDFRETIFGASEKGWYDSAHITPDEYRDCCFETQKITGNTGFISNIIENHDEPRGVSRYIPEGEADETSKKMLSTIQLMLRGIPFLYQGQEIGMENMDFDSIDEINDISTLDEYQVALNAGLSPKAALKAVSFFSRDNCRTPFQWTAGKNAGFSSGTPWLRVNPNYTRINADDQTDRKDSLYTYYRRLIALRKDSEYTDAIVYGSLKPFAEQETRLMAFYRYGKEKTLFIAANYRKEPRTITLPQECKKVVLSNCGKALLSNGTELSLRGYEAVILEF